MDTRMLIAGRNPVWNARVGWAGTPGAQWVPSLHPDDPNLPIVGGRTIRIVQKSVFAFDGRRESTETFPLRTRIDARAYASLLLVVRVHALAAWEASTSLDLSVYNESVSDEDLGTDFVASSPLASVTVLPSVTPPWLGIASVTGGIAGSVRVVAEWSQGIEESTAPPQTVELSVDVVGRTLTQWPVSPITRQPRANALTASSRPSAEALRANILRHPNGAPGFGVVDVSRTTRG
jgi:hypothetical protein